MIRFLRRLRGLFNKSKIILILKAGPVYLKEGVNSVLSSFSNGAYLMAVMITEEEKVLLKVFPKTKKGNPAKVDGKPVWASSNPDVVVLEEAHPDGFAVYAKAVGPVGVSQVTVKVDADLGEGVKELVARLDVEVVAAEAATLEVTPEVPVLQ